MAVNYFVGSGMGAGAGAWAGTGAAPAFDPGGLSPRAGPSPEAVAAAGQRLAWLARDIDAVRFQLGCVETREWRSPAAAVFREALAAALTEMWVAVQAVDGAAEALGSHALALQLSNEAMACASPLAGQAGAAGPGGTFGQFGMGWRQ